MEERRIVPCLCLDSRQNEDFGEFVLASIVPCLCLDSRQNLASANGVSINCTMPVFGFKAKQHFLIPLRLTDCTMPVFGFKAKRNLAVFGIETNCTMPVFGFKTKRLELFIWHRYIKARADKKWQNNQAYITTYREGRLMAGAIIPPCNTFFRILLCEGGISFAFLSQNFSFFEKVAKK